jgi:2'-hydroxyisoflavone reductase
VKILILGGTRFLGYHLAGAARAQGHEVTLFHRGRHPVATVPGAETILGDRRTDLGRLDGRTWDAVVDTSGYLPGDVAAAVEALAPAAGQYIFISSLSVYRDCSVPGLDETAPLVTLTPEQLQEADAIDTSGSISAVTFGRLYGGLKVWCERAVEDAPRCLVIRCGLIAGPYDYTDRLTYWAVRVARGGEVLAPAPPEQNVQFIDARDLAGWIVRMAERQQGGIYNATGAAGAVTMASLLESCREVAGSEAAFTWADERFLLREQVAPWTELPLWIAREAMPHMAGFIAFDCRKAAGAGLSYRPLPETLRDTLEWYRAAENGRPLRAGLSADRERLLLQRWRAAGGTERK